MRLTTKEMIEATLSAAIYEAPPERWLAASMRPVEFLPILRAIHRLEVFVEAFEDTVWFRFRLQDRVISSRTKGMSFETTFRDDLPGWEDCGGPWGMVTFVMAGRAQIRITHHGHAITLITVEDALPGVWWRRPTNKWGRMAIHSVDGEDYHLERMLAFVVYTASVWRPEEDRSVLLAVDRWNEREGR